MISLTVSLMATTPSAPTLSVDALMTRGYSDRVIPLSIFSRFLEPFHILRYARHKVRENFKRNPSGSMPRSRAVSHSVPKHKHLRRSFSIPDPLIDVFCLPRSSEVGACSPLLCSISSISSAPTPSAVRAVEATNSLNKQPEFRAQRSVGARYLLKTDIARFYPSVYSHSIPWALHGKRPSQI